MFDKLNSPFPVPKSWQESASTLAAVALFVAAFLWLFTPFGLHAINESIVTVSLCFGAITFCCGIAYKVAANKLLGSKMDSPSWTFWKWIIYVLGLIGVVSVGNFLYLTFLFPDTFKSLGDFIWMLTNTLLVGIIPVAFIGMLIQLTAQRRFLAEAQQLNASPRRRRDSISLAVSSNQFEQKKIDSNDILYVEALQNYVVVYWRTGGQSGKDIIRKTLSQINDELQETSVIRCHRSYLLNTANVEDVKGNAQGFKVRLTGLPNTEIPVSRTYINEFKQALSK